MPVATSLRQLSLALTVMLARRLTSSTGLAECTSGALPGDKLVAAVPEIVKGATVGVVALPDDDRLVMVPGDNLNPQKARILLMLALTRTRDLAEIRRMFAEY